MKESKKLTKTSQKNPDSHLQFNKKIIFYLLAIIALTYIVYLPIKKNKFTNWDDDKYILENKFIQDLSGENFKILLTKKFEGNYHPLTMISYALDYSIGKLNPKTYHLTNLLFHILNTCLVFTLIYFLLNKVTNQLKKIP